MDVFVTFSEVDVECAFDVVVTDVEKEAFEVVISDVTGYPTDAQTESAFAKWMDKPGVIDSLLVIDTVSGAVASFVPNSMIQTVKGLTVDIEPVQDLHGYDNPWPAGGGKNLLPMLINGIKSANTSGTWTGNTYVLNGVTFAFSVNVVWVAGMLTAKGQTVLYDIDKDKVLDYCRYDGGRASTSLSPGKINGWVKTDADGNVTHTIEKDENGNIILVPVEDDVWQE